MTINCNGLLIDLRSPVVMGILNITPDSFYDGGKYLSQSNILQRAEKILSQGARFIDIGGYSSRPRALDIPEEEEIARILPAVRQVMKHFPDAIISIDTFRSSVARIAVNEGAALINDIAGGELDEQMFSTVANLRVPYIMMHMVGSPQNMQQNISYQHIVTEINQYFSKKTYELEQLGLNDIIYDPGFGFSKTLEQNYELLQNLPLIGDGNHPVLVGISRKSMIYNKLKIDASKSLNGTTALHSVAILKKANILRVHDVKEAVETIQLLKDISL